MFDEKAIIKAIRKACDKDSKAYKITEYYHALTSSSADKGGINLAASKVVSIEKELRRWIGKHPNNEPTIIMQPEEGALCLIDTLRKKNLLK